MWKYGTWVHGAFQWNVMARDSGCPELSAHKGWGDDEFTELATLSE